MDYLYALTISYDGKLVQTMRYSDAVEAVHDFDKCVDYGTAKEYAVYNLAEPNGKLHTKTFHTNGTVGVK
jgi:antitoxin component YwqK of YwqJK toxin-antitoxin module